MRLSRRRLVAVLLALLCAAAPAFAGDEKVFKLKNGRKVRGEIVEESSERYVVLTEGATLALAKNMVASVEDAPRDAVKPREEPAPAKPPTPKAVPPAAADVATPSSRSVASRPGTLLASPAEVEAAKNLLATVPPADGSDSREKKIASLRSRLPLRTLVAVCSEPPTDVHRSSSPEGAAAAELLRAAPADEVRPLLARGIAEATFEKGAPDELIGLIARVGRDEKGLVEGALIDKGSWLIRQHRTIDALAPAFEKVGTDRSLAALYGWLLAAETSPDALPRIERIASRLIERSPDRSGAVRPLAKLLDPAALPDWPKLTSALTLLGASRKDADGDVDDVLAHVLDAVESASVPEAAQKPWKDCLGSALDAYAATGTRAARDRLRASLDNASSEEIRLMALHAIGGLRLGTDPGAADFLEKLVDFMCAASRSQTEVLACGRALGSLTHERFGIDTAKWRRYVASLR